ncbi:holo-[acyl-carrier protein] synthase [Edaphobacter lichenicola]|uniref:Holo-[acyl-carrier-protein] synthase n=2 Tax=Tunturiibacter TaxID=3154218 RepID=A0A7W8J6W5_9BACT|nr:holo-[acyl-carrier protein] synthase [Edaphobacter lichenicola]
MRYRYENSLSSAAICRCWFYGRKKVVRARFFMVLGVGTDLIETKRIKESIERYGEQFLERVFTAGEIAYCVRKKKNAAESFAARFAAKEAGAKALGTGISRGITWKELEVRREASGKPTLHLSGRAAELAKAMGVRRVQLSLTHSRELAMAVVVAED